jgi:hypothetical protein
MILRLVRISEHDGATLGALCFDGHPRLVTLEDPWRDNESNISCIPEGIYTIRRLISSKFGETFGVDNVPARSLIRFHWGNTTDETEGCILVGLKYGEEARPTIVQSQIGFKRFMSILARINEAQLIIVSTYGGGRSH